MKEKKLRAFISVSNKKDLIKWKLFTDAGHIVFSVGKTANELGKLGIPHTIAEDVTNFPSIIQGRAKKPRVTTYDVVVMNFPGFLIVPCMENIVVNRINALRAAARNGRRTTVVMDPDDYPMVIDRLLKCGEIGESIRCDLAMKVFRATSEYDATVFLWMKGEMINGRRLLY